MEDLHELQQQRGLERARARVQALQLLQQRGVGVQRDEAGAAQRVEVGQRGAEEAPARVRGGQAARGRDGGVEGVGGGWGGGLGGAGGLLDAQGEGGREDGRRRAEAGEEVVGR